MFRRILWDLLACNLAFDGVGKMHLITRCMLTIGALASAASLAGCAQFRWFFCNEEVEDCSRYYEEFYEERAAEERAAEKAAREKAAAEKAAAEKRAAEVIPFWSAATIPSPPPPPAATAIPSPVIIPPPPPPSPTWTGFSAGVNAGGTWSSNNAVDVSTATAFNGTPPRRLASHLPVGPASPHRLLEQSAIFP